MKSIHTVIPDIMNLIKQDATWFTEELTTALAKEVSLRVHAKFTEGTRKGGLRLSKMGITCPHALWMSVHHPELAEPLPPQAQIKYLYGHILEALVISLAKAAGHEVTGEQDAVSVDGIVGHRDCVMDGCVVDIKSSVSHFMDQYKDGSFAAQDTFGYLDQLDGYVVGSAEDNLVRVKDKGYILAIDKQLGNMVKYEHCIRPDSIRDRAKEHKRIAALSRPPVCNCGTVADGKSGNIKLDTKASYSAYKYECFPWLRTFIYAKGPVFLSHVVRKPDVLEVNKYGKPVYN